MGVAPAADSIDTGSVIQDQDRRDRWCSSLVGRDFRTTGVVEYRIDEWAMIF
jgi:hypothetical protein